MPHARTMIAAALLSLAGCGGFSTGPDEHGPAWIERPAETLVTKMGKPDRQVRLPPPSLATVYLYTGGAEPGFAVCQRDYFIRGATVIGYSEHGTAPSCTRSAGHFE